MRFSFFLGRQTGDELFVCGTKFVFVQVLFRYPDDLRMDAPARNASNDLGLIKTEMDVLLRVGITELVVEFADFDLNIKFFTTFPHQTLCPVLAFFACSAWKLPQACAVVRAVSPTDEDTSCIVMQDSRRDFDQCPSPLLSGYSGIILTAIRPDGKSHFENCLPYVRFDDRQNKLKKSLRVCLDFGGSVII